MGNTFQRNRFWWYRSLYDDYLFREIRISLGLGTLCYLPFYWMGIHLNREYEVFQGHMIYYQVYNPRRLRLTHSMLFESFEMDVEAWRDCYDESFKALPPAQVESIARSFSLQGSASVDAVLEARQAVAELENSTEYAYEREYQNFYAQNKQRLDKESPAEAQAEETPEEED